MAGSHGGNTAAVTPSQSSAARAGMAGLCAGLFLAGASSLFPQGPTPSSATPSTTGLPRAEEILKRAIERAKWVEEQKFDAKYSYTQRTTIDELDSKEKVKRHVERRHQVFPIDGKPYARLIQKDGKPLAEKDVKLEQEHERKFRERLAERKRKGESMKKEEEDIEIDEELISRYKFVLTGRERVNGRPAYVLSFEPRSKDLPVKRRIDRLLNKVAGRLWIDEQDYEVSRADAHLAENVSAWGGLLASVRKFLLRVEQTKVDETAWMLTFADGYLDGRILIRSLHMKFNQQNSGFSRIVPGSIQPATTRK